MRSRTMIQLVSIALGALAMTLAACGGGSSGPTDPGDPGAATLQLTSAEVVADGQQYEGGASGTFHHNHGGTQGGSTQFQATLMRGGIPASGPIVEVRFQGPGGHGMMGGAATFQLYDDGTHGDHTPGDGVYHFEDHDGEYGFHHRGAHHGQYHYDFFGLHPDGTETNHMTVDVMVED